MKSQGIALDDVEWKSLEGGYRIPYDASAVLKAYQRNEISIEDLWVELWENLHHQGDVGASSYATVPYIAQLVTGNDIDWNAYALAATIENCRKSKQNPALPEVILTAYFQGLHSLLEKGFNQINRNWSGELSRAFLMLAAAYLGQNEHSELMSRTAEEITTVLNKN